VKTVGTFAAGIALILCVGCGGDSADLRARVKQLEAENKALKGEVEKLSAQLRPLGAKEDSQNPKDVRGTGK